MTTGRTPALPTFCRFLDHQSLLPAVVRGERGNPFGARQKGKGLPVLAGVLLPAA